MKTIEGGKLFKGGNYSRKYGRLNFQLQTAILYGINLFMVHQREVCDKKNKILDLGLHGLPHLGQGIYLVSN